MAHNCCVASLLFPRLAPSWPMMRPPTNKPETWHVPVRLEDVPDAGLHLDLDADAEVRARLAAVAGVLDVPRLRTSVDLSRHGAGLRASGRVTATIGQTCVVTLEPMENTVDEMFDVLFVPQSAAAGDGIEQSVPHPDDVDDTRETLVDGTADVGAVATEFFLLGIDRYPRKPGAVFAPPAQERSAESPFAILSKLKNSADEP
jgi:Large ribosomal RNA subunit accumulation protein YceD